MKRIISCACSLAVCLSLTPNITDVSAKSSPTLNKTKVTLYADSTTQKKMILKVKDGKNVKWTTSNKKIVTVSQGKLTAKKKGKATISAQAGKKKLKCKVKVEKVRLSTSKLKINVNRSKKIKLIGEKIKSVKSSDKKIATIAKNGTVKGIKAGTAQVTIKGKNNKNYKATIQITGNKKKTNIVSKGECGIDVSYSLNKNGTLTISGSGEIDDYSTDDSGYNAPWYLDDVNKIIIKDGVTRIGDAAFFGCEVTDVSIPESVVTIGDSAFSNCSELTSITIPDSVINIEKDAFYDCKNLEEAYLGDAVTSIGDSAFAHCSSLKDILIPQSVTSIGDSAFYQCTDLEFVGFDNAPASIDEFAFADCTSLNLVGLGNAVTAIDGFAFSGCISLSSIRIPISVTYIADDAFFESGITVIAYSGSMINAPWGADYADIIDNTES